MSSEDLILKLCTRYSDPGHNYRLEHYSDVMRVHHARRVSVMCDSDLEVEHIFLV